MTPMLRVGLKLFMGLALIILVDIHWMLHQMYPETAATGYYNWSADFPRWYPFAGFLVLVFLVSAALDLSHSVYKLLKA